MLQPSGGDRCSVVGCQLSFVTCQLWVDLGNVRNYPTTTKLYQLVWRRGGVRTQYLSLRTVPEAMTGLSQSALRCMDKGARISGDIGEPQILHPSPARIPISG